MTKFSKHELVENKKGELYMIAAIPDGRKLEYCDEEFYEYYEIGDSNIWVRRKSEFEDGRFFNLNR